MNKCTSCGAPLSEEEEYKTLSDGTLYKEDFCEDCIRKYIINVDSLVVKDYAFQDITGIIHSEYDWEE